MTFDEGDLRFDFGTTTAIKFDEQSNFKLSHCMKAVDFILETGSEYYFIEVKDPDDPISSEENRESFREKLKSGELKKSLITKFRDTFIYRWAEDSLNKPVRYIVLLCMNALDERLLNNLSDGLRRDLPLNKAANWKQEIAHSCVILSLDRWNRHFKKWTVSRISNM